MAARSIPTVWWWHARDYAYALAHQVRAVLAPGDPERYAHLPAPTRPDVLLIPGVYESWAFLAPLAAALHEAGHRVHVAAALGHHRQDLTSAAAVVAAVLVERDLDGVVLVAHSKGGLVGKLLLDDPRVGHRVRGVVAVATPFAGARRARLLPAPSIQGLRPEAPGIRALARATTGHARIVSVFGPWDPHVPEGSVLPGARNVLLTTPGHFRVLADPCLPAVVRAAIESWAR